MPDVDLYGDIIDADTVEQAVRSSLQTSLVYYLAHQERRLGLQARTLPVPRSWPLVSEFDLRVTDQLPAVVIASPGAGTPHHDRGSYRIGWRIEIAVAIADTTEAGARRLAAIYLAAVRGAVLQRAVRDHPDLIETVVWTGPDDHAVGVVETGGQRAIYGTTFEVWVRDIVNSRKGPDTLPTDPYATPTAPPSPLTAQITVTSTSPGDTP